MARPDEQCYAIVPFAAAPGPAAALQALADDRMMPERVVNFPKDLGGAVRVRQLPGTALGAYAWTAGVELVRHAAAALGSRLKGARVLELGSGTGITAIALSRLGAEVIATDCLPDLVSLAVENAALNDLSFAGAECFSWGNPLPSSFGALDLLIGSEITYNEAGFAPLVKSLIALTENSDPSIIIAETLRNPQQQRFWKQASEQFLVRETAAVPQHDSWNARNKRAPIRIFELRRRKSASVVVDVVHNIPQVEQISHVVDSLQRCGACILKCGAATQEKVLEMAEQLFKASKTSQGDVTPIGGSELRTMGSSEELPPDVFVVWYADGAGDHRCPITLCDGYAALEALDADSATAWVPSALESRSLTGAAPAMSRALDGRRILHMPAGGEAGEEGQPDEALHAFSVAVARAAAPSVDLCCGEVLILDNHRMFHRGELTDEAPVPLCGMSIWTSSPRASLDGPVDRP